MNNTDAWDYRTAILLRRVSLHICFISEGKGGLGGGREAALLPFFVTL